MIDVQFAGEPALAARLDRLPDRIGAALAREIESLGNTVRDRLGNEALGLTVDSSRDRVTAILSTGAAPHRRAAQAGRHIARRRRPVGRAAQLRHLAPPPHRSRLAAAFAAMLPEIRAGLEAAVQHALAE